MRHAGVMQPGGAVAEVQLRRPHGATVRRALRVALTATLLLALGGCSTVGFYTQAVRGHLDVMSRARPIDEVVADPATPQVLKERLALVLRIREFAVTELGLPDNGSYRSYADLGRAAVVWNVFAAPEFSVEPRQWCFPIAGCVGYRGYFNRERAEESALRMREAAVRAGSAVRGGGAVDEPETLHTWIGPVPAYSTLGWFDDPVLNTFAQWPEPELARLIFHELAHQVVYVRDDTAFNESYAVAVELEGVRRWLQANGQPEAAQSYARGLARREALFGMLLDHRAQLAKLFASGLDRPQMRARRTELDSALRARYQAFRVEWGSPGRPFDGFDRWFGDGPNNAQLASIALYNEHVPAFQALLARLGGDMARFHQAVRDLAAQPAAVRRNALLASLK